MIRTFPLLVALVLNGVLAYPSSAGDVPARPEFGVLDRASLFPLPILKATERLIADHENLTGERISIVTVNGDAPVGETADAFFQEWRKTAPRPPNAVLIAVNADRDELAIRTGLGIDPVLPAAKIAEIRKTIFKPEWKGGKKSRAMVLTFVEVLRGLGSPLATENEAVDTYERAGFTGGWSPAVVVERAWVVWLAVVGGLAAAAFVLLRIMIGEVHYTAAGWFRVPASRNLSRMLHRWRSGTPSLVTGGGVSGEY